jgi:hypothetical protein
MDYQNSYKSTLKFADRIQESISQQKMPEMGKGLASRRKVQEEPEDFDTIRGKYINFVRELFTPTQDQMGIQEEPWTADLEFPTAGQSEEITGGKIYLPKTSNKPVGGYPKDLTRPEMEAIIQKEAALRNIEPSVAVAIFRSEGASNYQSQVERKGTGSLGGKEASFGPYQLYTGGGLGNAYEKATGRTLTEDNTREGVVKQIQFALDEAAKGGWSPWYGRKTAGVGVKQGLAAAKPIYNWKE